MFKAFLGAKSTSAPGVAGAAEAWSSIRDGLIFAALFGLTAFMEQANAIDFGDSWDGFVAAAIATVVQFVRRWMKDYSPDPTFPPQ